MFMGALYAWQIMDICQERRSNLCVASKLFNLAMLLSLIFIMLFLDAFSCQGLILDK